MSKDIPTPCMKKRTCTIKAGDSPVKRLHGKSNAKKTSGDNIILVRSFLAAHTKAMK